MTSIVSMRLLREPAYVLLGRVVAERADGCVEVERSPSAVFEYVAEARPMVRFFSTLRTHTEAIAAVESWGGQANDLESLVDAGTLVRFATDEAEIRTRLRSLAVAVLGPTRLADDRQFVYITLPTGRTAAISSLTAAVVGASRSGTGVGVAIAASAAGLDEDAVWRAVVHDLTSLLLTGAGHLEEAQP